MSHLWGGGIPFPAYAAQVTADSLAGYWKLDETSGTSAADSSGHANAGTHTNGPTISTDVPSAIAFPNARSLSFDGTDDYVNAGDVDDVLQTPNGTISAWVNFPLSQASAIVGKFGSSPYIYSYLGTNGKLNIRFAAAGGTTVTSAATPVVTANNWHHIAIAYNQTNTTAYFFVDGVAAGTGSFAGAAASSTYNNNNTLNIGRIGNGDATFKGLGKIDDVRIYNRALSPWEIAELAAGRHVPAYFTGSGSTAFESRLNWSGSYIPDPYSRAIIQSSKSRLTMTGAVQFSAVTINTGATLELNGNNLTINDSGVTTNYGALLTKGGETLTSLALTSDKGIVILNGSANVSSLPTGTAYNTLRIEDPTENGLVGYWKLDEGGGLTARDVSPNANTGTLVGGPTWSTDVPSGPTFYNPRSLDFDGAGDYVNVGRIHSNAVSLAGWVKLDTTASRFTLASNSLATTNTSGYRLWFETTGLLLFDVSNGSAGIRASAAVSLNTTSWYHWVGTYDSVNGARLYLDGSQIGTASANGNIADPNKDTVIGARNFTSIDNFSNGLIDDVRIYNRALSAEEVMNLYRGRYASGNSSTATYTLGANTTATNLFLDSGNLSTSSRTLTVTNALQLLRGNGSLTLGSATTTLNGGLTLSGGLLTGAAGTLDINGAVSILTGSLIAPSGTMTVSGNWSKYGGTFSHNSGTVTLDGTNQTLTGATTFYNLGKTVAAAYTLTFPATVTQTIEGTLTLNGAEGALLSLRSSLTGTAWKIDAQGSRSLLYLDVKDSNNINATAMFCPGCTNSNGNTNWSFAAASTGTIKGIVWNDANGDGIKDSTETTGLSGVSVALSGTTSTGMTLNRSTTTAASGLFFFSGSLLSNSAGYTVTVNSNSAPTGYIRTRFNSSGSNILGTGAVININFGYTAVNTLTGSVTAGATVFSGTLLTLTGTTGTGASLSRTAQSNASGVYLFSLLPTSSGSFTLSITAPSGYTTTSTNTRTVAFGTGGQIKHEQFGYTVTPTPSASSSSSSVDAVTRQGSGGGRGSGVSMSRRIADAGKAILARFQGTKKESDRLLAEEEERQWQLAEKNDEKHTQQLARAREERIAERIREHHAAIARLEQEQKDLQQQYAERREARLAQALFEKEKQLDAEEKALLAQEDALKEERERNRLLREERLADAKLPRSTVAADPEAIAERRNRLFVLVDDEPVLYRDVLTDSWYAPYVAEVITAGIAEGYKTIEGSLTGEFGVANSVTRAELLKMALESSGTAVQGGSPRNSTAKGTWASSYVFTAESLHLSVFASAIDVNAPATRGEVIQTLLEVMKLPIPKTPATFSDVPDTHPYSPAIGLAAYYGFITGDTAADGSPLNTFRPNDPINRAEVSKIIALVREVMK